MNSAVLGAASLFVFVGFVLATAALIVWNTFDNVIYLYYSSIGFLALAGLAVIAALIIPSGKDKKEAVAKVVVAGAVASAAAPANVVTPSAVPVQKVVVAPAPAPVPQAVISPSYITPGPYPYPPPVPQPVPVQPAPMYYAPPVPTPQPYYNPYPIPRY